MSDKKIPFKGPRRVEPIRKIVWTGTEQQDLPKRFNISWKGKLVAAQLRPFKESGGIEKKQLVLTSIADNSEPEVMHLIGILVLIQHNDKYSESCILEKGEEVGPSLVHDYFGAREFFVFEIIHPDHPTFEPAVLSKDKGLIDEKKEKDEEKPAEVVPPTPSPKGKGGK